MEDNLNANEAPELVLEAPEAASAPADQQTDAAPAENQPERMFTQADLDRILAGRLAKYSNHDALVAELAELKQKQMTDAERAIADAVAAKTNELTAEFTRRLTAAELRVQAQSMGFVNPDDVHLFVPEVATTADGEVDRDAVKAALEALKTERPYLVASQPATPGRRQVGLGAGDPAPVSAAEAFANAIQF